MQWMHLLMAATLAAGCAARPSPATLDSVAEGYVRVALQLAQHDPSLVEVWRGPESWRPGPRVPVAPLLQQITSLQQELTQVPGTEATERRDYLSAQLQALELAARRLLGESTTFAAEALAEFDYVVPALDERNAAMNRDAIARELPGTQPLDARYAAFKQQLRIPAAKAEGLMRAALSACRSATKQRFEMPADESTELVFMNDPLWDGAALYLGEHRTRIGVNRQAAMDVSRALRIACHEGYPGHHWQSILIDDELVQRRGWQEFRLAPLFGRHLFVNEGAAEVGVDLAFPADARAALYRDVLFPLAGLPLDQAGKLVRIEELVASLNPVAIHIIGEYLDGQVTHEVAANRLRQEALTLEPDAFLAFAERYRARVLAYPGGRAVVRHTIGEGDAKALRQIYVDRPFRLPGLR